MWSPEILAVQMKIGGFVLVNELLNTQHMCEVGWWLCVLFWLHESSPQRLGCSCGGAWGMRGLGSCGGKLSHPMWHVGFQFPDQGSNLCPLHWKADS